jgi:hypothetical protein
MEAASFCLVTYRQSDVKCVCLTIHPAGCGATMIRDVFSQNTGVLNRCPTPIILRKSTEWQARGYRLMQQASKQMQNLFTHVEQRITI